MALDSESSASTREKYRILIIEDDRDLNNLLKFTFEMTQKYEVVSLFDGKDFWQQLGTAMPDLAIIDIMLPSVNGTEILRQLRADPRTSRIPAILLTARSQEQDKIEGFEAGADDYITKPFSPRELLLRVQALLRRVGEEAPPSSAAPAAPSPAESGREICVGNLRIVPENYQVFVHGELISLTMTEFQLLLYLAERVGRLQSREVLLQKVWGYEGNVNTRTVDTHIKRLRQKLGDSGSLIETVHGFGYQLTSSPRGRR